MSSMDYMAEYAKSGRASCRQCKDTIEKQSLRIARMVPSRHHDGKDAYWHHPECFFQKQRVASDRLIQNVDSLRWDDQEYIRGKCGAETELVANGGKKGSKARRSSKGGSHAAGTSGSGLYDDFGVEYAKSSRSDCVACAKKIMNKEIRVSKLETAPEEVAAKGGVPFPRYHHVDCFLTVCTKLGFTGTAKDLPRFKELTVEDREFLENKFRARKSEELKRKSSEDPSDATPAKVAKNKTSSSGQSQEKMPAKSAKGKKPSEESVDAKPAKAPKKKGKLSKDAPDATVTQAEESVKEKSLSVVTEKSLDADKALIVKQNKVMYQLRDLLYAKFNDKTLKAADLSMLLEYNNQDSDKGVDSKLDRLSDIMVFGALKRCELCQGQYVFKSGVGYVCTGNMSAYTKCANVAIAPEREPFKVPDDLKTQLDGYKFKKVSKRVFELHEEVKPPVSTSGFVKFSTFRGWKFFLSSTLTSKVVNNLAKIVAALDGKVVKTLDESVSAVVTTAAEVKRNGTLIRDVKKYGIPVLKRDFVESFKKEDDLVEQMKLHVISDWTTPESIPDCVAAVEKSVEQNGDGDVAKRGRKRLSLEKEGENVKLKVKDGSVVDPDCPVASTTHVLKSGKRVYSVVLKRTDVDTNLNSFYKLQVLEGDNSKSYYVYRSWGRIGTTIGSSKLDDHLTKADAIELFEQHYLDKSGNVFGKPFVMQPGKYMLMDISYEQPVQPDLEISKKSNLPITVQHLVCLIFDVKRMQSTLLEFEIDTKKMPLGKISRDQILKAFSLLDTLCQTLAKPNIANGDRLVVDYSNQFFSLIPHNLGTRAVPVLKDKDMVREKLIMLEQLMEIELTYEMIRAPNTSKDNIVDDYYRRLNAVIRPVEKNSMDYDLINTYLQNTHAATHDQYALKIEHIYKVDRSGEKDRFEAFNELNNHQLLWHGSRTTNFAGILSQGLRIAPPEAPVTGYMFGKGIYFADMVSKSANYCYPSRDSTSGLLLLCEVALGESKRLTSAKDNLLKAPKGYQSVLGVGQTHPDPKVYTTLDKTIKVPYGPPVATGVRTDLLYNEYIVYDVAQVQLRYILNVEFDYKRK